MLEVSKEEREKHEPTHCPYRSSCKYCVMGRSHKTLHRRKEKEETRSGIPRISMDYCFMSQADDEAKQYPMLAAVDEGTVEDCSPDRS